MKNLIIATMVAMSLALSGCNLAKESNRTHQAIEAKDYDIEKVVVAVQNGEKIVTVHTTAKLDEKSREEIREVVMTNIPDANKVQIKAPK